MLTEKEKANLFEEAKAALAQNPTEGQVEKSVVFPLLRAIGYQEKNILSKVTVRVKAGSKNYENLQVDIIAKDNTLPTLVIEAKSPSKGLTLPNDYSQGMSYCLSPDVNTRFLFLTSGYSNRLYDADSPLLEYDLKTLFFEIEKFKEALLGKIVVEKRQPSATDIERFFNYSHNRMYAEDAIKPAEALHILTKLILIKTNEERGRNLYNLRTILEYKHAYVNSDEEKKKQIADEIYKYLADCLKNVDTDLLHPEERTISRNLSMPTLFDIVEKLNKYTLDSIPVERKGSAFDSFLNTTIKGREMGQFFTHRNIVNFMVDVASPKLRDRVIDPACGTGGFIEKAFLILNARLNETYPIGSKEYVEKLKQLQTQQTFGIDKDGSVASLSKLSMSMNGDGHTTIFKGNGLTLSNGEIRDGTFQIALTNPPFGSKAVVKVQDPEILALFDLGYKYKFKKTQKQFEKSGALLDGQDIGVLFLERCIRLLENNGFLGIILHDGVFSNSTYGYIRQYIRQHCVILAVVKLSDQAFKPYSDNAGTETTILLCRKGKEESDSTCFFATASKVGYKYKRHMMLPDESDFPKLLNAYKQHETCNNAQWIKLSDIPIFERLDPQYHCSNLGLSKGKFDQLGKVLKNEEMLTGFPFKSEKFKQGAHPLVKIAHLNNSILSKDDLETIPEEYLTECETVKLEEGDILLAMDGKKEFRASYVDSETTGVAVNQRIAILRVNKELITPAYVFLVLISKVGQKQLLGTKTQTATVAHLSPILIKNVQIPTVEPKTALKLQEDFERYIKSRRETERAFNDLGKNL